ncbi:MAG: hypothetical protein ABJA98_24165 [Acidobacteriota bacterium]
MAVRILVVIAVILAAFSAQEYRQIQALRRDVDNAQVRAAANAKAVVADWLGTQIEESGHALEWLHNYYKAKDGLQRPEGLWIDGHPDYTGISTWILDVYTSSRLKGRTDAEARQAIESAIRQSEEWRVKHPDQR